MGIGKSLIPYKIPRKSIPTFISLLKSHFKKVIVFISKDNGDVKVHAFVKTIAAADGVILANLACADKGELKVDAK